MKVIDLLNKIANGEEVPNKIQVYSDIFVFDNSNNIYEHEETRTNLLSIYNGNILNYEVRTIEDKKIEKIEYEISDDNGDFTINGFVFDYEQKLQIIDKINEIIDILNKE